MFNGLFQPSHLLLILVVVLIVFGPGKLPEVGKALGKTMRDMRSAFSGNDDDEKADRNSTAQKGTDDSVAAASVSKNTSLTN